LDDTLNQLPLFVYLRCLNMEVDHASADMFNTPSSPSDIDTQWKSIVLLRTFYSFPTLLRYFPGVLASLMFLNDRRIRAELVASTSAKSGTLE
jgi:hypothetical protein